MRAPQDAAWTEAAGRGDAGRGGGHTVGHFTHLPRFLREGAEAQRAAFTAGKGDRNRENGNIAVTSEGPGRARGSPGTRCVSLGHMQAGCTSEQVTVCTQSRESGLGQEQRPGRRSHGMNSQAALDKRVQAQRIPWWEMAELSGRSRDEKGEGTVTEEQGHPGKSQPLGFRLGAAVKSATPGGVQEK